MHCISFFDLRLVHFGQEKLETAAGVISSQSKSEDKKGNISMMCLFLSTGRIFFRNPSIGLPLTYYPESPNMPMPKPVNSKEIGILTILDQS